MSLVASEEIGLRALRRELTRVLDLVRSGNEVVVTDRGKPVARIRPFEGEDIVERLHREGRLIPARRPKRPISKEDLIPVKGSVSELIIAERERLRNP